MEERRRLLKRLLDAARKDTAVVYIVGKGTVRVSLPGMER